MAQKRRTPTKPKKIRRNKKDAWQEYERLKKQAQQRDPSPVRYDKSIDEITRQLDL